MHSEIDKRFMHLLRIAWHDRIGIYEPSVRCTQRASFRFPSWLRANAFALSVRSIRPRREIRAEAARKIASGSKDISAIRRRGKWNLQRINDARFSRNNKCKIRGIRLLNVTSNPYMRENDTFYFLRNSEAF